MIPLHEETLTDEESYSIKAYTAMGGELERKFPLKSTSMKVINKVINNSTISSPELFRKIDITEKEHQSLWDRWYEDERINVTFNTFQSFTTDKVRSSTYGGYGERSIVYKIPKGTTIQGMGISNISVYPEENEYLVGSDNEFVVTDWDWDSSGKSVLTIEKI